MGWDGMGRDGIGRDGMRWGGVGRNEIMRWDETVWDGTIMRMIRDRIQPFVKRSCLVGCAVWFGRGQMEGGGVGWGELVWLLRIWRGCCFFTVLVFCSFYCAINSSKTWRTSNISSSAEARNSRSGAHLFVPSSVSFHSPPRLKPMAMK